LTGYVVSSSERYSGPVDVEVLLNTIEPEAFAVVENRLRVFVQALDAGYFFPGARRGSNAEVGAAGPDLRRLRFEVDNLPKTALDVLGALLRDCDYNEACSFRSARAILLDGSMDLLRETFRRPAAFAKPPFEVDFTHEVQGDTLLVEIEFGVAVPEDQGERLLEELWPAYPLLDADNPEDIEPVEVFPAQRHFNDPRTIHHYESIWNADPESWNLLVNLCCSWSRTIPVIRLHIE
jgi:hypothetical protein